ncbi:MAG: alkylhydroperoxidase-related (seleno)protein [Actinomycetota bacterium]
MIDFGDSSLTVRGDIGEAHATALDDIARAGTWLTGTERVAIAAEVRAAPHSTLSLERKNALSPYAVAGTHESNGPLSSDQIEAIHRITIDPARLSRRFFDESVAAWSTPERYVEMVGVTVRMVAIDTFCRAIGADSQPLPEPVDGDPSGVQPEGLTTGEAWVPMLSDEAMRAEGLSNTKSAGNVVRALSAVPAEVRGWGVLSAAHYVPNDKVAEPSWSNRALLRHEIEAVATRVSTFNECFY